MAENTLTTMISAEEISKKIEEMGKQIAKDYEGQELLIVGVLKGAWIFMADLVRNIDLPLEVSFISVSSYIGEKTTSSGIVKLQCDIDRPLENKNLILVEDIVDTGLTLEYLKKLLFVRKPKTIKICTLLDKPSRRKSSIVPDYCGFTIPDEFVVGYGLDYDNKYRNLKDICTLSLGN
jgi:hypoxanthine phosphoribosyltransferase